MSARTVLGILLAAAMAGPLAHAQGAPPAQRIGVFDAGRLSEETNEGKRVQAELSAFREKKTGELAAKEKEINDLQAQLQAQSLSLSGERRQAMEKDIQRKMLDLKTARDSASSEFQLELQNAQGRFQDQLFGVVEQFARSEGFSIIFERSQVAFSAEAADITTALVDAFNRAAPAPPPAAPTSDAKPAPGGKK
jgi:Skp family chaperone for outer membrane proteins